VGGATTIRGHKDMALSKLAQTDPESMSIYPTGRRDRGRQGDKSVTRSKASSKSHLLEQRGEGAHGRD